MLGERDSSAIPGIFLQHPLLCRTLEPAQGEVLGCRLSAVDRAFPLSPIIPACPERLLRRVHMRPSLSLIIPAHPRHSPVSPIIPAHTQKQGGGGVFRKMCSPITLVFSFAMLTRKLSTIVGAPTFSFLHAACRTQGRGRKPKSTDRNVCATGKKNPRRRHGRRGWGTTAILI